MEAAGYFEMSVHFCHIVCCHMPEDINLDSHFPCTFLAFIKRQRHSIPFLIQKFHINTHNLCRCASAFLILINDQKVIITLKMNIHNLHKIQLQLRWNMKSWKLRHSQHVVIMNYKYARIGAIPSSFHTMPRTSNRTGSRCHARYCELSAPLVFHFERHMHGCTAKW
jgi:hypothetical protein